MLKMCENVWKSAEKVWKSAETILPFSYCPLVFLWLFPIQTTGSPKHGQKTKTQDYPDPPILAFLAKKKSEDPPKKAKDFPPLPNPWNPWERRGKRTKKHRKSEKRAKRKKARKTKKTRKRGSGCKQSLEDLHSLESPRKGRFWKKRPFPKVGHFLRGRSLKGRCNIRVYVCVCVCVCVPVCVPHLPPISPPHTEGLNTRNSPHTRRTWPWDTPVPASNCATYPWEKLPLQKCPTKTPLSDPDHGFPITRLQKKTTQH